MKCEECGVEVTFQESMEWCSENQYERCCNECYNKIVEETKAEVVKLVLSNKSEETKVNEKNCWNCNYHQLGEGDLLGKCLYFKEIGKKAKEIPPLMVDVGCKYFRNNDAERKE